MGKLEDVQSVGNSTDIEKNLMDFVSKRAQLIKNAKKVFDKKASLQKLLKKTGNKFKNPSDRYRGLEEMKRIVQESIVEYMDPGKLDSNTKRAQYPSKKINDQMDVLLKNIDKSGILSLQPSVW